MNRLFLCVPVAVLALGSLGMNVSAAKVRPSDEVHLRARLTGAAIAGVLPKGNAEYSTETEHSVLQSELEVKVEKVNVPDGTSLTVSVAGNPVGQISIRRKRGAFHVSSEHSGTVPTVHAGDAVSINAADGSTLLSGTF